jgi:lysophospholipase L1-like esterase
MRIVFFGDSLTWGGYGGNYVEALRRLRPEHELINAGRGGDTVVNLLDRLDDDVLAHNPDGVFVLIGGNDAVSNSQPLTRNYYRRRGGAPPDGEMTIDLFAQSYRELLSQLQLAHVLTWVGLPPNEYNHETVAAQRAFNATARDIAVSMNVPVLDLMAAFPPTSVKDRPPLSLEIIRLIGQRESEGFSDYRGEKERGGYSFTFDGLHFTPEAAEKLAEILVAFLEL